LLAADGGRSLKHDQLTSERSILGLKSADRPERRNPQKEEEQRDHRGRRYVIPSPDQTVEVFGTYRPFEELTRCSLLNRIAQSHKLIYSLICPHIMLAFKIVHRRGGEHTALSCPD
jgi:hypothetical protein